MLLTLRSKINPWFLAIRPKTLTAALIPVFVATILSKRLTGTANLSVTFFALLTALFIQIGANLINDACDFRMGADTGKRLGPKRATLEGWLSFNQVFFAGSISFAIAAFFAAPLIMEGGWIFAFLLIISIFAGYMYTYSSYSLAYNGLGDLFVFLFFGLIACNAVFWLQTKMFALEALLASVQIGLLATVMIAVNNLRDIDEDKAANKKTMACRFGKKFARAEITCLILLTFILNIFWYPLGYKLVFIFPFMTLPLGVFVIRNVWQQEPCSYYNKILGVAALLHQAFGWLIILGFLL